MTPQEARNKRFDEKFVLNIPNRSVTGRDKKIKSFIQSEVDLAISDYQTNFEQKRIASAVEVAKTEAVRNFIDQEIERKMGMRKIHKEFECNGAHNGKGCYENWCDMKTCISKDALHCKSYNQAIDEDITHLTLLKELIK